MNLWLFCIGSIAVSGLVHLLYHEAAVNQMVRVSCILNDLGGMDMVDALPKCVNFIYASTFIPILNMGLAFFFSMFIIKVERLRDEQLTKALINGME